MIEKIAQIKDEHKVSRDDIMDMKTSELLDLANELNIEIKEHDKKSKEKMTDIIWKIMRREFKVATKKEAVEKLIKVASYFDAQGMEDEADMVDGIIAGMAGVNENDLSGEELLVEAMDENRLLKVAQTTGGFNVANVDTQVANWEKAKTDMQTKLDELLPQVQDLQTKIQNYDTSITNLKALKPKMEEAAKAQEAATKAVATGAGAAGAAGGAGGVAAGLGGALAGGTTGAGAVAGGAAAAGAAMKA